MRMEGAQGLLASSRNSVPWRGIDFATRSDSPVMSIHLAGFIGNSGRVGSGRKTAFLETTPERSGLGAPVSGNPTYRPLHGTLPDKGATAGILAKHILVTHGWR